MENKNIDKMIYLIILFSLFGCKYIEVSKNTPINNLENKNKSHLDSLELYNLLYSNKQILPSQTNFRPFTLSTTNRNDTIIFSAKTITKDIKIKYDLYVKSSLSKEDFKWYNEDQYENIRATFTIDKTVIDIMGLKFFNSDSKIYPAGLWHWSLEDVGSIKMTEYNNKIYILLNGVDLFCNGSQCSSYQLYALVYDKVTKLVKFNAILTEGLYPYQFSTLHLFKSEMVDKLPEFYILKNGITEIYGIEDFNVYGFKENGEISKN